MKTIRIYTYLLGSSFLVSWLSSSCANKSHEGTIPQMDCRLQRIVSTIQKADAKGTSETVYAYDNAGKLLKKTQTDQYQYTNGGSETTTRTDQYTYDANSFLKQATGSTSANSTFGSKTSTYQLTSTTDYVYADNRLTAYTQTDRVTETGTTSSSQPRTTVTTSGYSYNAAGQLTNQTFTNGETITYQDGLVVAYAGAYPIVVENGLVTKASFPGTNGLNQPTTLVQINQYDDQRRLVRHQEWTNDTLDSYYTQAWQTGKPAQSTLPLFKGHPLIQPPAGQVGVLTQYALYFVNHQQADQVYPFSQTTTTNQLNTQGFVSSSSAETTYFTNGQKQPDITTTVYTYTGCN